MKRTVFVSFILIVFSCAFFCAVAYSAENVEKKGPDEFYQANDKLKNGSSDADAKEAIDLYKKAIEKDKNFVDAYVNLGNTYLFLGELDNAMQEYKKALEKSPKNGAALRNLGICYLISGNLQGADANFLDALNSNNLHESALASVYLGKVSIINGYINPTTIRYIEDAKKRFKTAINKDPKCEDAYIGLAMVYGILGNTSEALQTYQKLLKDCLQAAPEYMSTLLNSEDNRLKLHDEKIFNALKQAVAVSPDNTKILGLLALGYFKQGEPSSATLVLDAIRMYQDGNTKENEKEKEKLYQNAGESLKSLGLIPEQEKKSTEINN